MKYYDLDRPTIIEEILEKQERNKPKTKDVLDKIRAEIDFHSTTFIHGERYIEKDFALDIIDKYGKEQE